MGGAWGRRGWGGRGPGQEGACGSHLKGHVLRVGLAVGTFKYTQIPALPTAGGQFPDSRATRSSSCSLGHRFVTHEGHVLGSWLISSPNIILIRNCCPQLMVLMNDPTKKRA